MTCALLPPARSAPRYAMIFVTRYADELRASFIEIAIAARRFAAAADMLPPLRHTLLLSPLMSLAAAFRLRRRYALIC